MLIADSTARALENIAAREREVIETFPAQGEAEFPGRVQCQPPDGTYLLSVNGDGSRAFTRPAALYFHDGELTDGNGNTILGYKTPGSALAPLRADSVDSMLGWSGVARIGDDGAVGYERSAIDPLSGERHAQYVTIGRLALARFPAGTKLAAAGGSLDAAPAGILPHVGVPGDGSFPNLASSAPQSIDRNLDDGLQRLQEAYLSLDALRAAGAAQGSTQKTAMDLLK